MSNPLDLPWGVTLALNLFLWPILQLSIAWGIHFIPIKYFKAERPLFKIFSWERNGIIYKRILKINLWKQLLPDGAAWFSKGFSKKNLKQKDTPYLQQFKNETCRGETAHWLMILCAPLFFLWNPWWGNLIMIAYALIANLPCIINLRHTRARLTKSLKKHSFN